MISTGLIRTAMLEALEQWSDMPFSWPDDGCVSQPWSYWVHAAWVGAWNSGGRTGKAEDFLRAWLASDEHIASALADWKAFAEGEL